MFRALCAYHQEVKILLYSIWYHHTSRCDDTRCCIIQSSGSQNWIIQHLVSSHM